MIFVYSSRISFVRVAVWLPNKVGLKKLFRWTKTSQVSSFSPPVAYQPTQYAMNEEDDMASFKCTDGCEL